MVTICTSTTETFAMRKEVLCEIVKNFVKSRTEDPYAFFTASLRMRKFKISCYG